MHCHAELQPLQQPSSDFGSSWPFCFHCHIRAGELVAHHFSLPASSAEDHLKTQRQIERLHQNQR